MSEQESENTNSQQQLEEDEKGRGEGEGEERVTQPGAEEITAALSALKTDTWQEDANMDQVELPVKAKQASVQSVFSLVRKQIRAQSGLETRRTGMLQLVKQVTRQLNQNKDEEQEVTIPVVEVNMPEDENDEEELVAMASEMQGETLSEEEVTMEKDNRPEEECLGILQEVLDSIKSLRKEVRDELSQLRREFQSYSEQTMQELEARLMQLLRTHTLTYSYSTPNVLSSRPPLAVAANPKKQKPLAVPPLGASKRRMLSRTMTTIIPKTCLPPTLGPRSMSEPLGARATETTAVLRGSIRHVFPRAGDPLGLALGPLPPAPLPTQNGKKTRKACKPAS